MKVCALGNTALVNVLLQLFQVLTELLKVNIPANTSAVYQIQLGNASPTEEPMSYDLSVDPASNPDGAIVKVNGQPLTQPVTFRIDPRQSQNVTVTIDKGPVKYNYSDIVIQLESACETELADARGGDTFVDNYFVKTLNLSAKFIEPCSPVDIGSPLQGFVVTPAIQNVLKVTLTEYNKRDTNLNMTWFAVSSNRRRWFLAIDYQSYQSRLRRSIHK